jgi:hypothetical protein
VFSAIQASFPRISRARGVPGSRSGDPNVLVFSAFCCLACDRSVTIMQEHAHDAEDKHGRGRVQIQLAENWTYLSS